MGNRNKLLLTRSFTALGRDTCREGKKGDGRDFVPKAIYRTAWQASRIRRKKGRKTALQGRRRPAAHSAPLRVYRFSIADANDRDVLVPFGLPGAWIVAPPLYDQERRILVCFDSANAKLGAWRYEAKDRYEKLWILDFRSSNQLTLYADTGELLVDDVEPLPRWDAVVLDIETGREKGRVDTGCVRSGGMWYTPGFERDFYTTTGGGRFARIWVE